jgi:predicted PurR-regulated permease PerM
MAEEAKKVTTLDVIIGFASFIPFLGVFLGLAAFIIGFIKASVGGLEGGPLGVGGLLVNAASSWSHSGRFPRSSIST